MKIKSVSDVITNSSSEVFIISYPSRSRKELENLLVSYNKRAKETENGSGMGGILSVTPVKERNRRDMYISRIPWLPDSLEVDIDWDFPGTIELLKTESGEELYNTGEEIWYPIYDPIGERILKITSDYEEWKSYENPFQRHGRWAIENMDWWNYEERF